MRQTVVLGIVTSVLVLAFAWAAGGATGIVMLVVAAITALLVPYLWNRPSRWAKGVAIFFCSGILLRYLLPRDLKERIAKIPPKD